MNVLYFLSLYLRMAETKKMNCMLGIRHKLEVTFSWNSCNTILRSHMLAGSYEKDNIVVKSHEIRKQSVALSH